MDVGNQMMSQALLEEEDLPLDIVWSALDKFKVMTRTLVKKAISHHSS